MSQTDVELPPRLENLLAFFVLAFLMHFSEEWDRPLATLVFLGLAIVVFRSGFHPVSLLVFSLAAHVQVFANHFPDMANHLRVFVGCNLGLTLFSVRLVMRRRVAADDALLVGLVPMLMLILIATYLYAGFHKLNWDFATQPWSCALDFGERFVRGFGFGRQQLPESMLPWLVAGVYLWELVLSCCLLFARTQLPAVAVCMTMHWILAPAGFLDFAMLAWSVLVLFLDDGYHEAIERRPVRLGKRSVSRRGLFFAVTALGAFVGGIHFWLVEIPGVEDLPRGFETLTGFAYIATCWIFLWPAVREAIGERRFRGVPIGWRQLHAAYWLPLALVVLNGFQPYLGLGTGGAYSMFSNLRTEGPTSNHLLLGSNPFKVFSFQEDVVEVIDAPYRVRDHGIPLRGFDVPMVEFRKMMAKWRARERVVPIMFVHDDVAYDLPNLWDDARWQPEPRWYDGVLDFRIIPRDGPNECQW